MTNQPGVTRYHRLFERLGAERARALMDKPQVVALTSPETLGELEAFLDRTVDSVNADGATVSMGSKRDPNDGD